MDIKVLNIAGEKRNILTRALLVAAACMDTDMARIYHATVEQISQEKSDKLQLTHAQRYTVMSALNSAVRDNAAENRLIGDMLRQLSLTRKQYHAVARNAAEA